MDFSGYEKSKEIEEYLSKKMKELVDQYREEIDFAQDSEEHKDYMRNSDECFIDFVAEKYFLSLEKTK